MTQVSRKSPCYAKICDKNHKAYGINEIKGTTLENLVAHKIIRWGSNKNGSTVLHMLYG